MAALKAAQEKKNEEQQMQKMLRGQMEVKAEKKLEKSDHKPLKASQAQSDQSQNKGDETVEEEEKKKQADEPKSESEFKKLLEQARQN